MLTGRRRAIAAAAAVCLTMTIAWAASATPAHAGEEPPGDHSPMTPQGPPKLPVDVKLPPAQHPLVQWTLTMDLGGGFAARDDGNDETEGIFHFGGHSQVMFGRHKAKGVGMGICLDAGTRDFDSFVAGAGVSLLIPFAGWLPLIIEAWPHYEWYRGSSGGVTMRLWWGLHARNYLKSHVPTMGLYIQASRSWGERDAERWILVVGVDFSLLIPMLPLMSLVNLAFR